ncbi:MAG: excinuclease ABC subunit UvrA, partial [Spirochaetales bacterium]|nr:excinuclease ABC subunit UvrA [Spirochaetales bacterium]
RLCVHQLDEAPMVPRVHRFSTDLHCPDCDIHYMDPVPNQFSFNSPLGACETCRGFGRTIGIDYGLVIPEPLRTLREGAVKPWRTGTYAECQADLMSFAEEAGIRLDTPWSELNSRERQWVLVGEGEWAEGRWYGVNRFFAWQEGRSYRMHIRVFLSRYRSYDLCPDCKGARLKDESLLWRVGSGEGYSIRDLMLMPLEKASSVFKNIKIGKDNEAAAIIHREIVSRLEYLDDVGLGYLTLDRQSRTLSGGEVQRINLTTALGTTLVNTLFVLDEPSIGLHSRDIGSLIVILKKLRDTGNTLIIVEHDPELINAADNIIDLGPGPGEKGGEIVFSGSKRAFLRSKKSLTAAYLRGDRSAVSIAETPAGYSGVDPTRDLLTVMGASENNLQGIDVNIPMNQLVCITGVSGSGKSTFLADILYRGVSRRLGKNSERPGSHQDILGWETLSEVTLVDQSPIGRTTRSNPVSYVGALDSIRKIFSNTPLAVQRGYSPGNFSYNSEKGRCPVCSGSGFERVEMQFLSDVYISCPECNGSRYRSDILEVRIFPDDSIPLSIGEVLNLTVDEAVVIFRDTKKIHEKLKGLLSVGLGYLRLGQPVPTLSGGEAQRLKLAGALSEQNRANENRTLFLFDEPTTGLHFADVALLLSALRSLLENGHSVVVIEHNLDV